MQRKSERRNAPGDWRHLVAGGLHQSGLLRAFQAASRYYEYASDNGGGEHFRKVRKPKYIVLGYHSVGARGFPLYCRLPQSVFAGQMRYLRRYYRLISLRQMIEELQDPNNLNQGVVVTFDDGYLGTYTGAFPVLKEYAIPATIYLAAGLIESGDLAWYDKVFLRFQRVAETMTITLDTEQRFNLTDFTSRVEAAATVVMYLRTLPDAERQRWCEYFEETVPVPQAEFSGAMMNWHEAREMSQAGISFGCHTMTHPVLSRLAPDAVQQEVAESKRLIENRLDIAVEDFAFPFGKPRDCGSIGAKLLSGEGFRSAMTTIMGVNEGATDRFRLRRMVQGDELSVAMFALRLQRLFFHPVDEVEPALIAAGA